MTRGRRWPIAAELHGYMTVPEAIECLAYLAGRCKQSPRSGAPLGTADSARHQTSVSRYTTLDEEHQRRLSAIRNLGERDFQAAWDEGAALTIEEAIAYVRRGRGEHKRPSEGWASLTAPSSTWSGSSVRASATRRSPLGSSFHRAPCRHISPTSTRSSGSPQRVQLAQEASRHS